MKLETSKHSQRTFVRSSVAVAFSAPLLGALPKLASAAELPKVNVNDPQAKALQYVHDAGSVDDAKRDGADKVCATRRFYTDAKASDWGPCRLFAGKSFSAKGWCASWVGKD